MAGLSQGDTVHARVLEGQQGLVIESIEGDQGRLSKVPEDNCVGIAAYETLKLLGMPPLLIYVYSHEQDSDQGERSSVGLCRLGGHR